MYNAECSIRLDLNPNIIIERINNETMLYNPDTDSIIVLNTTGGYIYDCIVSSITKEKIVNIQCIVDRIMEEFSRDSSGEVEYNQDVLELLQRLVEEKVFYV